MGIWESPGYQELVKRVVALVKAGREGFTRIPT